MYLKTNVKLGEITNLSDARFAAGRGAQFAGFNLTPNHEKYIAPENVQEIIGWLDGPKLVGEWNSGIAEIISDTAERLQLHYIQLNFLDIDLGSKLQEWNIIQNLHIDQPVEMLLKQIDAVQHFTHTFMLSFAEPEKQESFLANDVNVQKLASLCSDYPVLLNFQFTEENLLPVLEKLNPFGINLKGDDEIKPGYKDFDELNNIIDLLEE
ncbi:MAG: hypothetical protein EOP53_07205 [Sphingobacteriales bacterium]|nr:MAG: hypothetical protein EOP53_07205 [Sphingobacteriales bacterium]